MSKKALAILLSVAALILVASLLAGVGSFSMNPKEDLTDDATDDPATDEPQQDNKPMDDEQILSTLSFPDSDDLTAVYLNELVTGVYTYNSATGKYDCDFDDPSGKVCYGFDFPDEDLVFRVNPGIRTWVCIMFWHTRKGSLTKADLTFGGCFESSDGLPLTHDVMRENFHIYTRNEIQQNLQNEDLTDDQLNQLIDLLVCQGCFIESSVDQSFSWRRDYRYSSDDYYGNRICMRYSVTLPHDVMVSIKPGYEYILYMFESADSYYCDSTVGWTNNNASAFVIPANTPFCIALRPEGLGPDVDENNRDDYESLYTNSWMDIIDFHLVKIHS